MAPLVVDPCGYLKPHHSVGHCLVVQPVVVVAVQQHLLQRRVLTWRSRDPQASLGRLSHGVLRVPFREVALV